MNEVDEDNQADEDYVQYLEHAADEEEVEQVVRARRKTNPQLAARLAARQNKVISTVKM